jgi:hypothetical protein
VKPGQGVGHRHLHRGLHRIAQARGVALAADLGPHARHQFVAVDRPDQEVVNPMSRPRRIRALSSASAIITTETLRVRSSVRSWLHSRSPSKP